jgi:protein-disulfide isomerase
MALPRQMKAFYFALGIILVVGGVLIAQQVTQRGRPGSVTETFQSAPVAPVAPGTVGHVLGSDSAPVEIVEFADFECPACARFAIVQFPDVYGRLIATGRLRWRFMDFPLQGHTNSPTAHLAAACADEQGKFFPMLDLIFNRQNDWAFESRPDRPIRDFGRSLGLDLGRYDSCMETRRAQPMVDADYAEGERLGVNATPTFIVNGRMWPTVLDYDQIKAIVDSLAPVAGAPRAAAAPARR